MRCSAGGPLGPTDTIPMKKLLQHSALLGLLLGLLPSCQSILGMNRSWDHWNASSLPARVDRVFLGYDPDVDGTYQEKLRSDFAHIRKTCARVFLNHNEENPFQY